MRLKNIPVATWASLLVVASGVFLTSCGGGGTGNNIPFPVVTLSPASASVAAGAPLQLWARLALRDYTWRPLPSPIRPR
jgi:hypothetical protein